MSEEDHILEELLLSEGELSDSDVRSRNLDLEALINGSDLVDAEIYLGAIKKNTSDTQFRSVVFGDNLRVPISSCVSTEKTAVYANASITKLCSLRLESEIDSDEDGGEDECSSVLENILKDAEFDDDYFDGVESGTGSHQLQPLFRLDLARRRECSFSSGACSRLYCGPLDTTSLPQRSLSPPVDKHSYFCLGAMIARAATKSFVTAVYVDFCSISLGTNEGCITVHSLDQEILKVLSHGDLSSPVTVIGISGNRKYLVCGYQAGVIAVWSIVEELVDRVQQDRLLLMYIDDLHSLPLKFLKVISTSSRAVKKSIAVTTDCIMTFVSSDESGATYRVNVKKSMFRKYSYESDCLLTGKGRVSQQSENDAVSNGSNSGAQEISSLAILPPMPQLSSTAVSPDWGTREMLAFSTGNSTFIVQLRPSVTLLHRWNSSIASRRERRASISSDADKEEGRNTDIESGSENGTSVEGSKLSDSNDDRGRNSKFESSLSWCWGGAGDDHRAAQPLLLRIFRRSLQVLHLSSSPSPSLSLGTFESNVTRSPNAKGAADVTFSCVDIPTGQMKFLSASWADKEGTTIAALSDTHIVLLSYPQCVVIDKIPLLPDMTAVLSEPHTLRFGDSMQHRLDSDWLFECHGDNIYFLAHSPSTHKNTSLDPTPRMDLGSTPCFYRIGRSDPTDVGCESSVLMLVQQGKWLEALGLCILSDLKCHTATDTDSSLDERRKVQMAKQYTFFDGLIKRYAVIAVYRHSFFMATQSTAVSTRENTKINVNMRYVSSRGTSSYGHYQLAAQVCLQFCTALRLTGTLFNEISETFRICGQEGVFLNEVAGYVVTARYSTCLFTAHLRCLPLGIITRMEKSAETSDLDSSYGGLSLSLLEKCVLSLDVAMQRAQYGLHGISDMMLKHGMFSGFLHFRSGAECSVRETYIIAFRKYVAIFCTTDSTTCDTFDTSDGETSPPSRHCSFSSNPLDQQDTGYKILLFLEYSLARRTFPTGEPSDVLPGSLIELLEVVILGPKSNSLSLKTSTSTDTSPSCTDRTVRGGGIGCSRSHSRHAYLHTLSLIDPDALLRVLAKGIRDASVEDRADTECVCDLYMRMYEFTSECSLEGVSPPSTGLLFHYIRDDLLPHASSLPLPLILSLIRHCSSHFNVGALKMNHDSFESGAAEKYVCALVLCEVRTIIHNTYRAPDDLDRHSSILTCLTECNCWRAALLLETGMKGGKGEHVTFNVRFFNDALTYYTLSDSNAAGSVSTSTSASTSVEVFEFLDLYYGILNTAYPLVDIGVLNTEGALRWTSYSTVFSGHGNRSPCLELFRQNLISYIVNLATRNMSEVKRMVRAVFKGDIEMLITATDGHSKIQYELLSALLDDVLSNDHNNTANSSSGSGEIEIRSVIKSSILLKYVSLMLTESRGSLFHFLTRCRSQRLFYPVSECLQLCLSAFARPTISGVTHAKHDTLEMRCGSWILLDSISLLREEMSDARGAVTAIVEYITFAVKEENAETSSGSSIESSMRPLVLHGVEFLHRLCSAERSRQGSDSDAHSRERLWYIALDSLLPILGE